MRIVVVSDSHGNDTAIFRAHEQAGGCDLLIHTGDGEQDALALEELLGCRVLRVAGNCDIGSTAPRELVLELAGTRLLITHGDRQYVKSGLERLYSYARERQATVVLFGHTHLAHCEERDGLLLLNPGTLNRQAGYRSFAVLTLGDGTVQAEIRELV